MPKQIAAQAQRFHMRHSSLPQEQLIQHRKVPSGNSFARSEFVNRAIPRWHTPMTAQCLPGAGPFFWARHATKSPALDVTFTATKRRHQCIGGASPNRHPSTTPIWRAGRSHFRSCCSRSCFCRTGGVFSRCERWLRECRTACRTRLAPRDGEIVSPVYQRTCDLSS